VTKSDKSAAALLDCKQRLRVGLERLREQAPAWVKAVMRGEAGICAELYLLRVDASGQPVPVGKVPLDDMIDEGEAGRARAAEVLRNWRNVHPPGETAPDLAIAVLEAWIAPLRRPDERPSESPDRQEVVIIRLLHPELAETQYHEIHRSSDGLISHLTRDTSFEGIPAEVELFAPPSGGPLH